MEAVQGFRDVRGGIGKPDEKFGGEGEELDEGGCKANGGEGFGHGSRI